MQIRINELLMIDSFICLKLSVWRTWFIFYLSSQLQFQLHKVC